MDPIFDNRDLLINLKNRGYAIAMHDWEAVRKYEDQIDVEKQYDTKICGAFLTFETEDIMKKAIKIWKHLDPKVRVERAQEPSIYIWENISILPIKRTLNKLIVFTILAVFMLVCYRY